MANASTTIITATMLDAIGRFISNVGVPAAIAFFILWQLAPRLDQMTTLQAEGNTELIALASTCGRSVDTQPVVVVATPTPHP